MVLQEISGIIHIAAIGDNKPILLENIKVVGEYLANDTLDKNGIKIAILNPKSIDEGPSLNILLESVAGSMLDGMSEAEKKAGAAPMTAIGATGVFALRAISDPDEKIIKRKKSLVMARNSIL